DREEIFGQGRGLNSRPVLWNRQRLDRRCATQLSIGSTRDQDAGAIPHLPICNGFSDGDDSARAVKARYIGRARRRRVPALPLQRVNAAYAGGLNSDQDVGRPYNRVGSLGGFQDAGWTK